ncbi:MAG TPA: Hsp33 family molecular chaperone HslO [Steroidobacteraceae bacterium]|nr:Hsp33 family molecular chaperone HslO [Steroidobacteraceae bacterium]
MPDNDSLHRFLFEHYPIRGHLVHLDAAWLALLEHREYPAVIRDTLGQATAASVLLAATLKFQGHLSLQVQGNGPMHLLLAQCTSNLGVRALARYREEVDSRDLSVLVGEGHVQVTLDNADDKQRYQGIVPLSGGTLAQSLEGYFQNSEQLPTRLWLYADERGASGMLLQRLPTKDDQSSDDVDDAWRRVQLIADTLKTEELRALSDREILRRLFNEDDVRLFEPAPVFFRCTCSSERVAGMLQSLGREEIKSILADQGVVEVRCDFCNRAYEYDSVDVGKLFAESVAPGGGALH